MIHESPCLCDDCLTDAANKFKPVKVYHYRDEACECVSGEGPCDSCREALEEEIRAEQAAEAMFSEWLYERECAAIDADRAEMTDLGRWSAEG